MSEKKKYPNVVMHEIWLTPEKAKSLLQSKLDLQRPLAERAILKYVNSINKGFWSLAGETIKVDWYGRLIDGQHRCHAVLRTNKRIKTIIVYGLDPEVYKVIDTGKTRGLRDAFKIYGESNCSTLASAVSTVWRYKKMIRSGSRAPRKRTPTTDEALELLEANPLIRDSFAPSQKARNVLASSIGMPCHYMFAMKDKEAADEFFLKLATGEGFTKNDPIRLLRDKLIFNKTETKKFSPYHKLHYTIMTWNIIRSGKKIKKLRYEKGSSVPIIA